MCNDITHQKDFQEIRDSLAEIRASSKYTSKTLDDINEKISPIIVDVADLKIKVHDNEQDIRAMRESRKEMNTRIWAIFTAVILLIIGTVWDFVKAGGFAR